MRKMICFMLVAILLLANGSAAAAVDNTGPPIVQSGKSVTLDPLGFALLAFIAWGFTWLSGSHAELLEWLLGPKRRTEDDPVPKQGYGNMFAGRRKTRPVVGRVAV